MVRLTSRSVALSLSFCSVALVSCGRPETAGSNLSTVVGRGGAFFDQRVKVINAIANAKDNTACLYSSEYKKNQAPVFSNGAPLTSEQKDFLEKAELEAKPLTQYPVSIDELDRALSQKETLRKLRGGLLVPMGIASSMFGIGMLGLFLSPCGPGAIICGNMTIAQALSYPPTYGVITAALGGFGLLHQASRDLHLKNNGVRLNDAVANSASAPQSTNLGVTLAFENTAKSLPAASNKACPANLSAQALQPFVSLASQEFNSLSDADRSSKSNDALSKLKSSKGCFFAADAAGEKTIYKANPLDDSGRTLHLQTYRIRDGVGAELVSDEELQLQLKNDAGAGSKYVADNERGSVAIWLAGSAEGKTAAAKLSRRLPSGEYAGGQAQINGQCQLLPKGL